MDKYGVQYDDEKVKAASQSKTCPQCGKPLDPTTPRFCKDCGTEPWEKRPDPK